LYLRKPASFFFINPQKWSLYRAFDRFSKLLAKEVTVSLQEVDWPVVALVYEWIFHFDETDPWIVFVDLSDSRVVLKYLVAICVYAYQILAGVLLVKTMDCPGHNKNVARRLVIPKNDFLWLSFWSHHIKESTFKNYPPGPQHSTIALVDVATHTLVELKTTGADGELLDEELLLEAVVGCTWI
jgi:hypothetical protein